MSPGMTREAAAGLARAMAQGAGPVTPAWRAMVEACRRAGALEEAWLLLRRLAEAEQLSDQDRPARALLAIARRAPPPAARPTEPAPCPFVRERSFLPGPVLDRLRGATLARLEQFHSSEVSNADYRSVDASRRRSRVLLRDVEGLRRMLMPHVRRFVDAQGVPAILGLREPLSGRHEVQATHHGDGDFFKPHVDSGDVPGRGRAITFVFYYDLIEGSFSGGDLLLYDVDARNPTNISAGYTRLPPENNSIVFFPSHGAHEVEPVATRSSAPAAGRFTLTGWLHW